MVKSSVHRRRRTSRRRVCRGIVIRAGTKVKQLLTGLSHSIIALDHLPIRQEDTVGQPYDLVVIGGGPAGYPAAIRAAQMGARVALAEGAKLGGVCLNRGCIPTKALIHSAEVYQQVLQAAPFGVDLPGEPGLNFARIVAHKQQVVGQLVSGIDSLLRNHRVALFPGWGTILGAGQVGVRSADGEGVELEARAILIATGSQPAFPPVPGVDLPGVISGEDATELGELPERLVIVGGGVIGVELASLFHALGVQVTVVEMQPMLLPAVGEVALTQRLRGSMRRRGVDIRLEAPVQAIAQARGKCKRVILASPRGEEVVEGDLIIMATGRRPRTAGLGLEELGVTMQGQAIGVDALMQTNIPGLFAAGDCTGRSMLASVASYQGLIAAENALGSRRRADYRAVPNAIFTIPELASVGLTEREARELGIASRVSRFPFSASGRALALGDTEGQVRMICEEGTDRVLGVHIMGPHATELIAEASLAVRLGLTAAKLAHTIHAHPTLSEVILEAAWGQLGGAIHHHRP
jgi:dihydrolipoamide dehydrogenase